MSTINRDLKNRAYEKMAQESIDQMPGGIKSQGDDSAHGGGKTAGKAGGKGHAHAAGGAGHAAQSNTSSAPGGSSLGHGGKAAEAGDSPVHQDQLDAVTGLADTHDKASADAKVTQALSQLSFDAGTPSTTDHQLQQDMKAFSSAMSAAGRSAQAPGALRDALQNAGMSQDQLSNAYSMAKGIGLAVDTSSAKPDVNAAKDQLDKALKATPTDQVGVALSTAHFVRAQRQAGQTEQAIGTNLMGAASGAGVSGGDAAALYVTMAKLGLLDPNKSKDDQTKQNVVRAQQQAAQEQQKAQQAAAQEQSHEYAAQTQSQAQGNTNSGSTSGATNQLATKSNQAPIDWSSVKKGSGVVPGSFKMGVLPDYDNGSSGGAAGFEKRTGVTPSVISGYADMKNGSFDLAAAKRWIDDGVKSKVGEVSMSVSAYETGSLNASQLQGVKDMIAYAKQSNVKLDIRYGYEMNYGGGGAQQGGRVTNGNNPAAFQTQWKQVADLAHAAEPPSTMIWAPNIQSSGDLPYEDWLPRPPDSVDVYAVDYYPPAGASTADIAAAVKPVADLAAKANKPFVLGEVAVKGGGSATDKAKLLQELTSPEMRAALPNYNGFFWFDYNKGGANMSLSQDDNVASNLKNLWSTPTDSATTGTPGTTGTTGTAGSSGAA